MLEPSDELLELLVSGLVTPEPELLSDEVVSELVVVPVSDEVVSGVVLLDPVEEVPVEEEVSDESSLAAHAVSAPVITMAVAAIAARCRRDVAIRRSRGVLGVFVMRPASSPAHQGRLSRASNAGQMLL